MLVINGTIKDDTVTIDGSNIQVPVEIKSADRLYEFGTATPLTANSFYISEPIDCSLAKKIQGHFSADQTGTLYIQQSEDGATNWLTTSTIDITASTMTTINGVDYDSGQTYDTDVTSRWARVVCVNGGTDQTKFVLSGYTSVL